MCALIIIGSGFASALSVHAWPTLGGLTPQAIELCGSTGGIMSRPVRVLVADGCPVYRRGLRALIAERHDMVVVGEAGDGMEAVRLVGELQPDIVLLGQALPGINALAALELIVQRHPRSRVILLTQRDRDDVFLDAVRAGAASYLPKMASEAEVIQAVQAVYAHCATLDADRLARLLRAERLTEQRPRSAIQNGPPLLGDQEMQLLLLLCQGCTNKEIARTLDLTEAQVRHRLSRLYPRLGVSNRTGAVRYAAEKGWVRRAWGDLDESPVKKDKDPI
jgi:DNA-binding NarL/FixJ family response regulator